MKRLNIMLLQVLVTAVGLWYAFHDPQRRAQIAEALRHADMRWVLLGWVCYSSTESELRSIDYQLTCLRHQPA